MRRLLLSLLSLLALVVPVCAAPVAAADGSAFAEETTTEETTTEETGRLVLVLDSSGSMKEPAPGGTTKIQAAKQALEQVTRELPDDAEVGVRVFGAKVFDRSEAGACTDTQNVVPVGPLDRDALTAAVADYQPYGETPIGAALQGAAQDLGPASDDTDDTDDKPRTIVLLSDGEPTCQPAPCKVARQLAGQGIGVKINVVGLDVSGKARQALRCIARAGNGQYYDAASADDLANSLVKVSARELRGFRLTGEPVTGGETTEQAVQVEPGTYIDTSLTEEDPRWYLIDKPDGGGVTVSAMARPPRGEDNWSNVMRVELQTPDGTRCAENHHLAFQILGFTPIASTGARYDQFNQPPVTADQEECAAADELVVAVSAKAPETDYRLQVSTTPAVENADALPEPVELGDQPWVQPVEIPAGGDTTPVVGGVNFDDAPELEPGTVYADTLRPSEQLVYKVRAGYGQAVRLSARLGSDRQADDQLGIVGPQVMLRAFDALGQGHLQAIELDRNVSGSGNYDGRRVQLLTSVVPPIRVRNGESTTPQLQTVVQDGYQYFVLGMGRRSGEGGEFAAPVRLAAETVGEMTGEPEYAGEVEGPTTGDEDASAEGTDEDASAQASVDAEDDAAASSDDDLPGWLPWALGGLAVVLVAGGAFLVGRRSRG